MGTNIPVKKSREDIKRALRSLDGVPKIQKRLNWRDDPKDSLSDWKIIIKPTSVASEGEAKVYNVHKNALLYGGSGYFKFLFRSPLDFLEKENSTITFEFHPLACEAFPSLLDYLYFVMSGSQGELKIEGKYSAALRFLADYFDTNNMLEIITETICDYIGTDNCLAVLQEAHIFHDKKLVEIASQFAIDNFAHLADQDILSLPPNIFQSLLKAGYKLHSELWDGILKQYIEKHSLCTKMDEFRAVTACEVIPEPSVATSKEILKVLGSLYQNELKKTKQESNDGIRSCPCCDDEHCLLTRSMVSLASNTMEFDFTDVEGYVQSLFEEKSSKVLAKVFEAHKRVFEAHKKMHINTIMDVVASIQGINPDDSSLEILRVTGAGVTSVNGVYFSYGESGNYEKLKGADTDENTFQLYKMDQKWYIEDAADQYGDVTIYYESTSNSDLPYDTEWTVWDNDVEYAPVPIVRKLC